MSILKNLAEKYDVDKLELGFLQHYENRFESNRFNVTKVLEIGVETGRSHRMWLEYFPNATIYGVDIFETGKEELDRLQQGNPNLDRSILYKADQSDPLQLNQFLDKYGKDFDIIIDDGGHSMKQQQISLKILFNAVKKGGTYVIEDLHTCSGEWPTLYDFTIIEPGDTITTELLESFENKDDKILETSYLSFTDILNIKDKLKSCKIEIGVEKYINPKGYTYKWPTMLSFIEII
mgnify:CR=1 FL=1|tara:strand:+ start:271 stop:975 length:705 start_codon:yes stop_codon:yes gene_type:complete